MKRPLIALLLVLVAATLSISLLWTISEEPPTYQAITAFGNQARPLVDFRLTRHDGAELTPEQFRGRWSLLFFGYTHCPDICSPTLSQLTAILNAVQHPQVQIAFITTDPERDTPEKLARFIGYFHDNTWGITGDIDEISKISKQVGAFYAKRRLSTGYLIDHSASVWLIDPQARVAGVFTTPLISSAMQADLQQLIAAQS